MAGTADGCAAAETSASQKRTGWSIASRFLERGHDAADRRQARRAGPMTHSALDRHVGELGAGLHRTEQQSATAHVAPADELDGKEEPLAEDLQQHVDIFRRR